MGSQHQFQGRRAALLGAILVSALATSCYAPRCHISEERLDRGYAAILVGILGNRPQYTHVADGLVEGGVPCAIEVKDWSLGPAFFALNQRLTARNRHMARKIGRELLRYQDEHPGRPTFVMGHSGGAGLALMVLEELPEGRSLTGAVLLGVAVAPDYNLAPALRKAEKGIWSYWSKEDTFMLGAGTLVLGNFDGYHGQGAGLTGFQPPEGLTPEDLVLYDRKLHEVHFTEEMRSVHHNGGHWGWTKQEFAKNYLAPLLVQEGRMRSFDGVAHVATGGRLASAAQN